MSGRLDEALAGGPDPAAPGRLHALRASLEVGAELPLSASVAAAWPADLLAAVLEGAGFVPSTRPRRHVRSRSLADTVAPGMRLLVVGLNPSEYAADVGVGFARPGNRFWPAALAAGLVTADRDPVAALRDHGVGMTDVVKRATPRADQLSADEYRHGIGRLELLAGWLEPTAVCFVGLAGWRAAVERRATTGWQERSIGGRPTYVMPNPSGLNAHVTVDDLADHFRTALAGPAT